jgi:hypothetical protein
MTPFDPAKYAARLATLWRPDRLPALGPGSPNEVVREELVSLGVEAAFPVCHDRDAAKACISGLWLYHDFLDESHAISQELPGWIGSYWHAIMHRREPDPDNAKYWFRRVTENEVFERLAADAPDLGFAISGSVWDPFLFVERSERERGSGSSMEEACRRVQLHEMRLLFDLCYHRATTRPEPEA